MKLGEPRFFKRSVLLAIAGILLAVLTACTGKGGGYLPPGPSVGTGVLFTGQAAFGFTFSCARSNLDIELAYTDKGSSPISSPFGIHGIVDQVDPVLESEFCIGENPPQPPNLPYELTFVGRYWRTSGSAAMFPTTCPTQQKSTSPLCRFEVHVVDNDQNMAPSPGDFFSITLSDATCTDPTAVSCSKLPDDALLFYTRAGTLAGGNITVK
jgi:hypothetical protein